MKIGTAVVLLGAALACASCSREAPPAREDVRPVRSTVVGATRESVGASYSGVIQARYESKLGFQSSGKVVARLVEVGSHVRRGQPLLRLDPQQQALHVVSATADVAAARSRVSQDRVDLERLEQLLRRQFASQAEVDQQRLALAQAESQLASALAQQQIRVNQRGYTELLADRDGVVTAIHAETGQVVSAGQAVVTVAADGEREVLVSIAESRVEELRTAKSLQVTVWAQPGRRYDGALRELAPSSDSVTRTYAARISVTDPERALMLGMTATVHAPDVGAGSSIRLPLTAILDREGRSRVWVVDAQTSTVSERAVTLAGVQKDAVLVASGIAAGETVVTAGVHMLYAGQKVKAAGTSEPRAAGAAGAGPAGGSAPVRTASAAATRGTQP